MSKTVQFLFLILLIVFLSGPVLAEELFVFPQQGQSQEQMEKDKFECYNWAKQQTGFDPMARPTATEPPPQQETPQGNVVRGAARGALVGAAVGGIANDDAGKGAAAGAAAGALFGGMRRRDQMRSQQEEQQRWEQQQASIYNEKRSSYNRAYAACLEAKGYTVK